MREQEFTQKLNWDTWKKIFLYNRNLWPWMAVLGVVMVGVAVLDGVFPQLTRHALDVLLPQAGLAPGSAENQRRFLEFGATFVGLGLAQGFNVWLLITVAAVIEVRLVHTLRHRAFQRLQELSFSWYDRTPAGWIQARMTSDAQKLGDVIAWGIVDLVWGSAMMLACISFMVAMDPGLALLSLVLLPVLGMVTWYFQTRILSAQRKARKSNSLLSGVFNEDMQGAKTSKVLGTEDYRHGKFTEGSSTLRSHALRAIRYSTLFLPLVVFLSAGGAAIALGAGMDRVMTLGLSLGTLVAFMNYTMLFFDPAREVARVLSEFQAAQASAERLISLMETVPEIQDREEALASPADAELHGELEFRNVSFRYQDGPWILQDFNLRIPAGQTLAIVGETGSGKSTLVNLACRFYEPVEGEVLIDGLDYRQRTQHWLHSRLGYVLQTPLLFNGSIRDNIRYGRLNATDQEVEDAARQANALEFVQELEAGFDTLVGEGGVLLSTGQKQLISLARALVANPRIMVLDEATSSIDTEAERLIQGAVDQLLHGRTSMVIAHRLSTVRNAHRIIVLDRGKIIEDGTHQELLDRKGRYWRLYTRQYMEEEIMGHHGPDQEIPLAASQADYEDD